MSVRVEWQAVSGWGAGEAAGKRRTLGVDVILLILRLRSVVELLLVAVWTYVSVYAPRKLQAQTHCKKYSPSASAKRAPGQPASSIASADGLTIVMPQVLHSLEVGQTPNAASNKLPHREHSIAVGVQLLEHLLNNLLGLFRVHLDGIARSLATLLVVHAVDGFQLVHVEDAVAAVRRTKGVQLGPASVTHRN